MRKYLAGLALICLTGTAQASTITIDFEDASPGAPEVLDSGFRISGTTGLYDQTRTGVIDSAGDQLFEVFALLYDQMCACSAPYISATIEREDGGAFSFHSADWSGTNVSIQGLLGDGSYALDAVGTGDWLNVVSVTFNADGGFCTSFCFNRNASLLLDDVVVGAAVPVPAAVWLFGSALAGLGWMRRKPTG